MSRAARGWTGGCIAAVLLVAAGVLLLVALGRSFAGATQFEPSPDDYPGRAQALVLDVNPAESYDGRGIDVEFTAGSVVKVADIEIDHGVLPQRGDRVAIAYDTDDPDDAVLVSQLTTSGDVSGVTHDGGNAALAFAGLGCGLAAVVAGIVTIVWARRAPSGKAPPPAYGYGAPYGPVGYGPQGYGGGYVPPYGWVPPPAPGPYGPSSPPPGQSPPGPLSPGLLPQGRPASTPPAAVPPQPPPPGPPQPPVPPQPPDPGPDGPASPWGGPG